MLTVSNSNRTIRKLIVIIKYIDILYKIIVFPGIKAQAFISYNLHMKLQKNVVGHCSSCC